MTNVKFFKSILNSVLLKVELILAQILSHYHSNNGSAHQRSQRSGN